MPTREHLRAQHALRAMRKVKDKNWASSYRSYVDRLGPAILRNGLGQALAGELAAAGGEGGEKEAHLSLYRHLEDWLCGKDRPYKSAPLLEALINGEESDYLRAHAEALAWLEWHKRFCRAYLKKDKKNKDKIAREED